MDGVFLFIYLSLFLYAYYKVRIKEMGFCYFCQKEGDALKKNISQLEMERDMIVGRALTLEKENEELFQRCAALEGISGTALNNINQKQETMIDIVKKALISLNMEPGEADNFIHVLLKI